MHKCKCRNTGASMLLFYPCENLVWHIESSPLMSVQHFFFFHFQLQFSLFDDNELITERITLRKKLTNVEQTDRK